jgi:hypothetical protein
VAEAKRFLLRLEPALFEVLRRWADDDLRSINAQIEYLLAEQAQRARRWPPPIRAARTSATRRPPRREAAATAKPSGTEL